MKTGLLWYDADPQRGLEDKVGRAAQRYREKFGHLPDVCYVNPKTMDGRGDEAGPGMACRVEGSQATIRILSARNILAHHFWLGENGDAAGAGLRPGH
jgi:hypothetical protein